MAGATWISPCLESLRGGYDGENAGMILRIAVVLTPYGVIIVTLTMGVTTAYGVP
jgi:hypothetical protein